MSRGPQLQPLVLIDAEIARLTAWSRRPKTARALAERAQIVLASATGAPNLTVADVVGVTFQTVGKWRRRFLTARLDGLLDAPRPGAPRSITDGDVERVVRKTLEERPAEATHWSTRLMAKAAGVTQTAVVRIWHAYRLQPHRVETFKLSTDPQFIDKVRDVVGLYRAPPERALVLCVDENLQVAHKLELIRRCSRASERSSQAAAGIQKQETMRRIIEYYDAIRKCSDPVCVRKERITVRRREDDERVPLADNNSARRGRGRVPMPERDIGPLSAGAVTRGADPSERDYRAKALRPACRWRRATRAGTDKTSAD